MVSVCAGECVYGAAALSIFRNSEGFPRCKKVDFLEENQLGSIEFGRHLFGKCLSKKFQVCGGRGAMSQSLRPASLFLRVSEYENLRTLHLGLSR